MEPSQGVVKSSNITEIVHKFARFCKLHSIGVFSKENHFLKIEPLTSKHSSSEATKTNNYDRQKVYPQPPKEKEKEKEKVKEKVKENGKENTQKIETHETLILKLFSNISALKATYVQLHVSHTPYDLEKIQNVDWLVIIELKNISELKHSYREKEKPLQDSGQDTHLLDEIQEQQSMLKMYSKSW